MARRDALDVLKHDPAIGYSTTRTLTLLTGPSFFEATHASRTTTCFKTLLMDTGRTTQPLHPPRHAHTLLHTSCDARPGIERAPVNPDRTMPPVEVD
jgi:hypothetical protein